MTSSQADETALLRPAGRRLSLARDGLAIACLVCALVTIAAAFLPWDQWPSELKIRTALTAEIPDGQPRQLPTVVSGIDLVGPVTLIAGVCGVLLFAIRRGRRWNFALQAALGVLVAVMAGVHLGESLSSYGMMLTFVAGLVWVVVALAGLLMSGPE